MQTIAGYNPIDVVAAAFTEKLHSLGARNINVDKTNDSVAVYASTMAGQRFGFKATIVPVNAANEAVDAVESVVQRVSPSVSQPSQSNVINEDNGVLSVLIEIRDLLNERL